MNYNELKQLDEDSSRDLQEGTGPVNECICSILAPSDNEPKGLRGSIKRAFASMGARRGGAGGKGGAGGSNAVDIPLTFVKGGKGIFTTKEQVKRTSSCGKCGCDNEKIFVKHSYANIRITAPDITSICPCESTACMPDKEKFNNNIRVTVEHVNVSDIDTDSEEDKVHHTKERTSDRNDKPVSERLERPSVKELVEHIWKDSKDTEEWKWDFEEYGSEDAMTIDSRSQDTGSLQDAESLNRHIEEQYDDTLKNKNCE